MPVPASDAPELVLVDIRCEVLVDCVVKDDLLLDAGVSVVVVTGVVVVVDTGALLVSFELLTVDTDCVVNDDLLVDAVPLLGECCKSAAR